MAMWGRMLGRGGRSQHYDRGIRLFDQGLYEQAIEAFRDALGEPKGGPLLERLARFYLAESFSSLALSQMAHGAPDEAAQNLREAISLSPNYADLHYHLGCVCLNRGEGAEAVAAFDRALEINPHYARACLFRGVALYQVGRTREGLASAERAVALDSSLKGGLLEQAKTADARGDRETAIQFLRQMGEADADDALFHARLALDLFRRGMYREAAAEYRQALAVNPNYADLRNQLGVTLHASGDNEGAVEEFAYALRINPRYVEARLNRGLSLRRLGREDDARADFNAVLDIDPENQAAQEYLNAVPAAA